MTFSAPVKLNTDTTTRPQWQPNLSVSPGGTLFAVWYDEREAPLAPREPGLSPATGCGHASPPTMARPGSPTWTSATWSLPCQVKRPDIVTNYAGDYDYGSAIVTKHVTSWVDGRVAIGGASQQDAFFDQELAGGGGTQRQLQQPRQRRRLHRHLLRQPQQRLLLLQLQRRHLGRHPRLGLSRRQGLVRLRHRERKAG